MINFEFSQLHPEQSDNFLKSWPTWVDKILQRAGSIKKSPALIRFLAQGCGEWDFSIGALFTLLHLIPPTAQGQGKANHCTLDGAKTKLINFFKAGTPLQSILDTWKAELKQPNLVCLGVDKKNLSSFFIACDGQLLPIASKNSTEAIDILFKSHYVFGTEYDISLRGLWKFIQVYIYGLETDAENLPRNVKQVFNQLN
ncbi:uncharacterized protein LOC118437467 [Folsomia candida]|nr:uncharacterized protein LOC118433194 [Folsomia candida]XP_035712382.1 uncharacterized protein LOC118437467 [Folsomia candida]